MSASRRVLLVEDSDDFRISLRILVQLWGHQVEEARDGREGVRKALEWLPDIAVVDIGLPLLDGYGVARQVREALDDRIVLIALTAYGQPEDQQRAFDAGFSHHLTKPANLGRLENLLRDC